MHAKLKPTAQSSIGTKAKRVKKGDEEYLPLHAGKAFEKARREALENGLSVLVVRDDVLYRVYPNGRRRKIKSVLPSVQLPSGFILHVR